MASANRLPLLHDQFFDVSQSVFAKEDLLPDEERRGSEGTVLDCLPGVL